MYKCKYFKIKEYYTPEATKKRVEELQKENENFKQSYALAANHLTDDEKIWIKSAMAQENAEQAPSVQLNYDNSNYAGQGGQDGYDFASENLLKW
jgi:hypothetical protein